jgi:alkylhydroperoxidase/carboxymuconolactone decarboxylase family protein YurZ
METTMQLASEDRVTSLDPVFGPMGIDAGRAIWSAPELTMREKAILLVAADVCVPEFGLPFELHVGMGLTKAGMSVEDFRELLRHIAPDAGYNIVAMAFQRLAEVAAQLGFDVTTAASRSGGDAPGLDAKTREELRDLDAAFCDYVDQQARQLWNRPGLSRRERCLATLAVLVVGGTLGAPFEAHVSRCLAEQVPMGDLKAAVRILAEFSIPKAWEALVALRRSAGSH